MQRKHLHAKDLRLLTKVKHTSFQACQSEGTERIKLFIVQPSCIESILKRFGMENCKTISTLLEAGKKFQMSDDDEPFNVHVYQRVVG